MAEFTTRLKELRAAKNMKQGELADLVGVRRETIIRLEKGQYNPSLKLAIDIARVFGCTVEEVFIFEEKTAGIDAVIGEKAVQTRMLLSSLIGEFKSLKNRGCCLCNSPFYYTLVARSFAIIRSLSVVILMFTVSPGIICILCPASVKMLQVSVRRLFRLSSRRL